MRAGVANRGCGPGWVANGLQAFKFPATCTAATELPAYSTAGLIQYSIISTARCGAAWYGARAPMGLSIRVWIRGWLEDGGHPGCYRPRFNNKRPRLPSWNPWSGRHYDGSVKSGPADGSVPSEGDNKSMTSDEEAQTAARTSQAAAAAAEFSTGDIHARVSIRLNSWTPGKNPHLL